MMKIKNVIVLFLVTLLFPGITYAALNDGLVAHWSFDGCNAIDDTGNGFDGTLSGNPLCVDGILSKAFDFDATDDHIRLNQSLNPNTIRAISFWINSRGPDGRNDGGIVLAKYHWTGRRSFLIYSHDGTTSKIDAIFYANGVSYDSDRVSSYYEDTTSLDPNKYTIINNTKLNTDRWEHVVVNVTGTEIEIWINGTITNKVKRDYLTYFNSSESTYIGNAFNIGGDFTFDFRLNGTLDDLRVYDRALSNTEIQELSLRRLSIRPKTGGDTGTVTAQILGQGFADGASVKLVREGESDIVGSPVTVGSNGTTISTTFGLTGRTRGLWDVVVTNPDSTSFTITDGFTIEEGRAAQVWVDIIGRNVIRVGRQQSYWLIVGNSGNVDAAGVYLWIAGIPKDAKIKLSLPILDSPEIIEAEHEKLIPFVIPRIAASSTQLLKFELTIPSVSSFELRAFILSP